MIAPRYRIAKLSALALMIQPTATITPPTATTSFGPILSDSQPASGVSHVSRAMKMLNAIWISAIPQPWAWFIGRTNNVQPYCKFAIITWQMMTAINCPQRLGALLAMFFPLCVVTLAPYPADQCRFLVCQYLNSPTPPTQARCGPCFATQHKSFSADRSH